MQLEEIVPFGRSRDEYEKMFNLTQDDLKKSILGVGDGPASFNAEMTAAGYSVLSVDPLYQFSLEAIRRQFTATLDTIIDQVKATQTRWVWSYHRSPEQLKESRLLTFETFATDFAAGNEIGRYVAGELPRLPFADGQFELAVCSHFLFLYSEMLKYEFHRDAVVEMLRVAAEVRIYPLLTLAMDFSPNVAPLQAYLQALGHRAELQQVDYEFQTGGTEMLSICRKRSSPKNV